MQNRHSSFISNHIQTLLHHPLLCLRTILTVCDTGYFVLLPKHDVIRLSKLYSCMNILACTTLRKYQLSYLPHSSWMTLLSITKLQSFTVQMHRYIGAIAPHPSIIPQQLKYAALGGKHFLTAHIIELLHY